VQMNRRKRSTIASNFERMHIFALAGVFLFGFFGPFESSVGRYASKSLLLFSFFSSDLLGMHMSMWIGACVDDCG